MQPTVFFQHAKLERDHWWFVGRRRVVFPIIDRLIAPHPEDLIVDIGCGTGGTVAHLADKYRCIGFDESDIAINAARDLYPDADIRLGKMPDDVRDLAAQIQLYLLMDVLEHIVDDFSFLQALVVIARSHSQILITVPAHQFLWSEHDLTAGHQRRYSRDQLRARWSGLPVRERLCTYYNARLYPIVRVVRAFNQFFGKAAGTTDFSMPNAVFNAMLAKIFGGERDRVAGQLDAKEGATGYATGVSLIAVLEKLPC